VWQELQEFGIFNRSASAGTMNRNVWLRTLMSAIVCSTFGMWQLMHSFPLDPAL
jgi:hypothetical protein